jgi:PAS domain S-box-containing protein
MGNAWREPSSALDRPVPHHDTDSPSCEQPVMQIDPAWELSRPLHQATREPRAALGLEDFDDLPDAIICTDASGAISAWNHAAETLFGYTAREALGTRPPIVPPEEEERADVFRARVMQGATIGAIEVERYDKAGNRLTLLLSVAPWRSGGAIIGVLATFKDLSAQKERERELARQIAREQRRARDAAYLAAVADACIAPIDAPALFQLIAECTAVWADSAGIVTHAAGASELAAYAARTPDDDGAVAALFVACATGFAGFAGPVADALIAPSRVHYLREVPLTNATLAQGYHTLAAVPIAVGGEVVATLYAAARGATAPLDEGALATLDQAAARTGMAIAQLHRQHEMQERADGLEAEARRKDDFLATVSHELRTPLTAILGFAHIIVENDGLGAERRRGMAEDIVASGGLLLTQVNDLLDIVQLGTGRLTVTTEAVDLTAVVRWCERAVRALMSSKALQFDLVIPEDLPPVRANAARLQQVLLNFLVNAYKFTPSGGTVTLGACVEDGAVSIAVRDTGIGIAPEHAARIFEPFERVESAEMPAQPGAGVGLAVARQLVALMGGAISLVSAVGAGSTFTVTLKPAE